jgi:hypothetical protein
MSPVFERPKIVHALDGAVTVIGSGTLTPIAISRCTWFLFRKVTYARYDLLRFVKWTALERM